MADFQEEKILKVANGGIRLNLIRNRFTAEIIFEGEADSLKSLVEEAVKLGDRFIRCQPGRRGFASRSIGAWHLPWS